MAMHTVKSLERTPKMSRDTAQIMSNVTDRLSTVKHYLQKKGEITDVEERLSFAEEKVWSWGTAASFSSRQSMIWDSDPDQASEYIEVVDDVRKLTESLGNLSMEADDGKLMLQRAHSVLQTAMVRLEEEFSHLLFQGRQPFEPDLTSFRSNDDYVAEDDFSGSFEDEQVENGDESQVSVADSYGSPREIMVDLVDPVVVPELKCIADLMLLSDYEKECCQAYITNRQDALDENLFIIGVEKLSIEEVNKMEWENLDCQMKKWTKAMKTFIKVLLVSEKHLCYQIFGEEGSTAALDCFIETAKPSMFTLLSFGDAIAVSSRQPEKLLGILGMYDALASLQNNIDILFPGDSGFCVRTEVSDVLDRLGDSVKITFMEFEDAIRGEISTAPFPRGGIHPLTKYVMNYIRALTDYRDSLDFILLEVEDVSGCSKTNSESPRISDFGNNDGSENQLLNDDTPTARRLLSVVSLLESNLEIKSKLYKDDALQHLFLMNNVQYMVHKVKNSDLCLLGKSWIKKHNGKLKFHATNYERASWNMVLSWLKDEGIRSSGSGSSSHVKTALKERFKGFNLSFEEIYKTQTMWSIPDDQLREELRISISVKLLSAYRTFLGRYEGNFAGDRNADKYIKYTPEDLEQYLLDLFEGSPGSLHSHRRR